MNLIGNHTEANAVKMLVAPIKIDLAGKSGVAIDAFTNAQSENVYRLQWTDYVINEWNEYYATLPLALARVAVLSACIETDDADDLPLLFKHDSTTFALQASKFINGQVE
jgi:hypothetical protein